MNRQTITEHIPYVLVLASCYLSIRQFIELGYSSERIAFLAIVMFSVVWLLSESLEYWLNAKESLKPAYACGGVFFAAIEIYLGHYGVIWLFGKTGHWLTDILFHYSVAAGFSYLTVSSKYLYSSKKPTSDKAVLNIEKARENLEKVSI